MGTGATAGEAELYNASLLSEMMVLTTLVS